METEREAVVAYLRYIVETRLKKHTPGLYTSLNLFSYMHRGRYISDLIAENPGEFFNVLKNYFEDEFVAMRMLRHILKPLLDGGAEGEEAINRLIRGDKEGCLEIATRVLREEAKRWAKRWSA